MNAASPQYLDRIRRLQEDARLEPAARAILQAQATLEENFPGMDFEALYAALTARKEQAA